MLFACSVWVKELQNTTMTLKMMLLRRLLLKVKLPQAVENQAVPSSILRLVLVLCFCSHGVAKPLPSASVAEAPSRDCPSGGGPARAPARRQRPGPRRIACLRRWSPVESGPGRWGQSDRGIDPGSLLALEGLPLSDSREVPLNSRRAGIKDMGNRIPKETYL